MYEGFIQVLRFIRRRREEVLLCILACKIIQQAFTLGFVCAEISNFFTLRCSLQSSSLATRFGWYWSFNLSCFSYKKNCTNLSHYPNTTRFGCIRYPQEVKPIANLSTKFGNSFICQTIGKLNGLTEHVIPSCYNMSFLKRSMNKNLSKPA